VTWAGFGAVMVTNVVLSSAQAWIEGESVDAAGLEVSAENVSTLEATATSKIEGFDQTFGAVVAFNSIGWRSSNVLFNALDALLGDPLLSDAFDGASTPSDAQAWVRDTQVDVTGDVLVSATQAAQLTATVGNEGVADAALDAWCAPLRKAQLQHRSVVIDGAPAEALMRVASEREAPWIVVGRRGRGGFLGMLLGSVPHALSLHATSPVVIVPTAEGQGV